MGFDPSPGSPSPSQEGPGQNPGGHHGPWEVGATTARTCRALLSSLERCHGPGQPAPQAGHLLEKQHGSPFSVRWRSGKKHRFNMVLPRAASPARMGDQGHQTSHPISSRMGVPAWGRSESWAGSRCLSTTCRARHSPCHQPTRSWCWKQGIFPLYLALGVSHQPWKSSSTLWATSAP